MCENSPLTILHISDFHYSKRKREEQRILVEALTRDLERLCVGRRKPDFVLFSGDLVHAAGTDSHDEAYDFVLDPICRASGCSEERLFITPGNHDVSRKGVVEFTDEMQSWRGLIGKPDEMDRLNELYADRAFDAAVAAKFHDYRELEDYLDGDSRGVSHKFSSSCVTVRHIDALNVDLVIFNTAVLSTAGHKAFESDERKLSIPEYAVKDAVKVLTENSLKIIVTHHPCAMLSEQSARYLESQIERYADLHLFGHMHDLRSRKIVGLKGEVLCSQAGALFTARRNPHNGYALITLDRQNKHAETIVRTYFADRDDFDDGVDIVEGGRWWSSADAKQYFRMIPTPIDDSALRAHLTGPALEALRTRQNDADGDTELHKRFVAPPLRRTFIEDTPIEDGKVAIETSIVFSDLAKADDNLIIYGKPEYGRTTLLREIRYQLLAEANCTRFPRLPALIDFRELTSNADNMLRKVRAGAEQTPPSVELNSLLQLGHVCILIDDVSFADATRMRILRQFIDRFPKARYVLSSVMSSATRMGIHVNPEMPVHFQFVEIREFRRNDMRQLLARDERCTDVERWLDRLQDEFREINLPFTAANGTILIEILSEKYNFTPINRSVLMEQFVDSTLRKASIEQSRRETFDYTNKTDLLSHVAAWMARCDDYIPPREDMRNEMKSYFDSRGLKADLDELFDEFLAARIFIKRSDSRVSFRYRGVLEYFIALRMASDTQFRDWVLEDERYLMFVNEIQYYAGKLRNDAALVNLVADRHANLVADALDTTGDIDLNRMDQIQLPSKNKNEDLTAIAHAANSRPLTQETKDKEREEELLPDAEDRQEVFRPKVHEVTDKLALSLFLYSGLVKNMELIPDSDKRRHLAHIWTGWAKILDLSLQVAPKIAKERRARVNGVMYEIRAPQGMDDATLLRQMMVRLPHLIIRLLSDALGTEKLERQLTEPRIDEYGGPKVVELLRTGLIAHLRLGATPAAIESLVEKLRENHYLLWSLVVDVSELRRFDWVREEHFRRLEVAIAEALATLGAASHKDRAEEKRKQLARLEKDRLLMSIRRKQER